MSSKSESGLQRRIRRGLEKAFGGFWFKVHGGPFQMAGIPDLLGCVEGRFIAIEIKTDKGVLSALQVETIRRIKRQKGVVGVARSLDEAILIMECAGFAAKESRRVPRKTKRQRLLRRAGNRKDVHSDGPDRAVARSKRPDRVATDKQVIDVARTRRKIPS